MPILNPQQAYNLVSYVSDKTDELLHFLTSLLEIASKNYSKNHKMMKIYNQFLDFIGENVGKIAEFFQIGPKIKGLINIEKENAYSLLYKIINSTKKEDKAPRYEKIKMNFAGLLDLLTTNNNVNIPDDDSYFYIPYHSKTFGWYISDYSYAVLVFNFRKHSKNNIEEIFKIRLSTYLIAACGYTLIACVSNDDNYYYHFPSLLKPNYFSETHIFAEIKKNFTDFKSKYFTYPNIGYVYLYVHFEAPSDEYRKNLEKCSNNNVKIFVFSKNVLNDFKTKSIFYDDKSIVKDKTNFIPDEKDLSAFSKKEIPVNLCNVALYNQKDRNKNWIPSKISGIAYGYINSVDFPFCPQRRVEVKISNENYYVEFPDIHYMNPELYVAEPMYLAKQNFDISIVEKIKKTYKDNTAMYQKIKVKNSNINANIEFKMHNAFHYLYKYTYDDDKKHIEPYTSQIYAAYQAITYLGKVDSNNKGIVLQVHTGEGKSFIVQALAEHLARQGSTVHIATSNIILAARDFEKAYNYYVKCEKKAQTIISKTQRPSILLHNHELQYISSFLNDHKLEEMPEKDLFYGPNAFKNSTNLNICVCKNNDKKKIQSNIIYSTFLNFEAFFLSQNEKDPNNIPKYINNCYLIIDEADTILIDELTNGTILSKPMKSNAIEILSYVYENYKTNEDADKIYEWIKSNYPECTDLTINDVYRMFSDIDKVKSKDFTFGKKYTIDKDPLNPGYDRIVPFDSEHKGIAEPNKEFSGFIHQFIGIKEKSANPEKFEKLIIQPLSLNYLFISHPTYVQKYKGVCGVTGTIGNKREQKLLQQYYHLVCQKVPRHQMNLRNDLPMILCNTLQERNQRICYEIETLHEMKYPILVVFNDINDLNFVKNMLEIEYQIGNISTFDGTNSETNEAQKKNLEENAGTPGAITLGTNFCGRGISIDYSDKPLHVIVSYYKRDKRSISQALGRAGRNGHPGTTRIICTKEMYWSGYISPNEIAMTNIINEFEIKNQMQLQFMEDMRSYFNWIFEETEAKEKIDKDRAYELRNCYINVNRITAFNFKFPICMSVRTFLEIQVQRIFSIKNCPECKYSWYLFRIYMRELILESWSLFLDLLDIDFKELKKEEGLDKENDPDKIRYRYNSFFDEKYEEFLLLLHEFIPNRENISIIDTFFYIHNIVIDQWQEKILSLNSKYGVNCNTRILGKAKSYTSIKVGTFPISLNEKSGSKLTPDSAGSKGCALITDPELKYIKKGTINEPFSITIIIDKIFESFHEIVDKKLENLFGIRFFLRRTLAGCEFGACIDLKPEKDKSYLNCLVDTDPMFILTLCTKSSYFWMSGILLIVLVFLASITTFIVTKFLDPGKLGKNIKDFLKSLWKKFSGIGDEKSEEKKENNSLMIQLANKALDALINCLYQKILNNVDNNYNKREGSGEEVYYHIENNGIFKEILQFLVPLNADSIDEKFGDRIYDSFRFSDKTKEILNNISPIGKLIKIGLLLILLLAQFLMNFRYKRAIKFNDSAKNIANTYQKESTRHANLEVELLDSYENTKKYIDKDIDNQYLNDK